MYLMYGAGLVAFKVVYKWLSNEGCIKRGISPTVLANVMAKLPAKAFGIYGQKGDIQVGFDADFTIIDPNKEWEIKAEDLQYVNKISAYVGKKGQGYQFAPSYVVK